MSSVNERLGRAIAELMSALAAAGVSGQVVLSSDEVPADVDADAWQEDEPTDELDFDPEWTPGHDMNAAAAIMSQSYDASEEDEEADEWVSPREKARQRAAINEAVEKALRRAERNEREPQGKKKKDKKKDKKKKGKTTRSRSAEAWFLNRCATIGLDPNSAQAKQQRKQCLDAGIDLRTGRPQRAPQPPPQGKWGGRMQRADGAPAMRAGN